MRKTYKEMFPGVTGLFTREQINACPYGGYNNMLQNELAKRFLTLAEIKFRMGCCESTARKYIDGVDSMFLEDDGKVYYDRNQAIAVIKSYLKKKEGRVERKNQKALRARNKKSDS